MVPPTPHRRRILYAPEPDAFSSASSSGPDSFETRHTTMPVKLRSPRLIVRYLVRLRREGGSISMTVPVHVVRQWKLRPGAALVMRSTDEGILLYPSFFRPFLKRPMLKNAPQPPHPIQPRQRDLDAFRTGQPWQRRRT